MTCNNIHFLQNSVLSLQRSSKRTYPLHLFEKPLQARSMYSVYCAYSTHCKPPWLVLLTAHPHVATRGHSSMSLKIAKVSRILNVLLQSIFKSLSFRTFLLSNRSLQQRSPRAAGGSRYGPTDTYMAQIADSAESVRFVQAAAAIQAPI